MTRTENSTKNMYTGLIYQVLVLLFRFITRTVFIYCLGEKYLGINGLFSNILNLLSLADLGIGSALVFALYKPIAEKNEERQKIIVDYLHKIYIYIGLAIIAIGIMLLPALKFIIKDNVDFVNLNIVFLIYIFQTASTYLFFPSKTEFLCANQQRYIYNNIANLIVILSNIFQIIVLIIFKNFIVYLITIIVFNILQSYLISKKTDKMYPFIKTKSEKKLTKSEKKEIFKDCGSLMIYRINYVVLTATDNIIVSKYLGLATVGIYSNYTLITNSIVNVLSTFFDSITASIGNLHAKTEKEKDYFIFKITNLITVTMFGIFSIGIYVLANQFITIWLGKEYALSEAFALILAVNLYVEGLRKFLSTYRTTYGLFRQAKIIPLFGMIANIVISIILVKKIGIFGVLLGTLISNLITFMWYDPYAIYKFSFKKKVTEYYCKNLLYFIFFCIIGFLCKKIYIIININGIIGFIIGGIICVVLPLLLIAIIMGKTEYGKYIKNVSDEIIKKIKCRKKVE